ncbi:MAG: RDD family protein [Saprospiraceae bacterium]|nr:RDD family protein [Saprospiraceae bacterium]
MPYLISFLLYIKRLPIYPRFIGVILALVGLIVSIPDLHFNLTQKEVKTFTIEELNSMSKSDIPRYVKIEGPVVTSNTYVEQSTKKNPNICDLYYPVYDLASVKIDLVDAFEIALKDSSMVQEAIDSSGKFFTIRNTDKELCLLIIKEERVVKKENLKKQDSLDYNVFEVEGRFDAKDVLPMSVRKLFEKEGVLIKEKVIVLVKDKKSFSNSASILLILGSLLLGSISVLSFFPTKSLVNIGNNTSTQIYPGNTSKDVLQEIDNYKDYVGEKTSSGKSILPKRIIAYIIDAIILILCSMVVNKFLPFLPIIFFLYVPYFVLCEYFMDGMTIGKRVLKIKTVTLKNHENSQKSRILLRNFFKGLLFPYHFHYVVIFFFSERQPLYDLIVRTTVKEAENRSY